MPCECSRPSSSFGQKRSRKNGSSPFNSFPSLFLFLSVFHIPFILALPKLYTLHSILERKATPETSDARDFFPGVKVVTTLNEVLDDEEVDLVVLSGPNGTHFEHAKVSWECSLLSRNLLELTCLLLQAALEAGKNGSFDRAHRLVLPSSKPRSSYVLSSPQSSYANFQSNECSPLIFPSLFVLSVVVEKPITPTFAEAQILVALAKKTGLVLATYQSRRFDSDFLTTKALIEEGAFGELSEFEVRPSLCLPFRSVKE